LLEMMKSSLKVESEYGKGSVFSFVLEQKVNGEELVGEFDMQKRREMELSKYQAVFTAPDACVLVVDDNGMNRKVFRNLLKQTKIQVDEAENGKICLQMVAKKHYDIIFMDHMMPGMDGIETFHAMQELPGNMCSETPVIILTANAVTGAKEHYLKEGFNAFLSKPVEPDKLEKIIGEMLPDDLVCPGETTKEKEDRIEFQIIDGVEFAYGRIHFQADEDWLESMELFYRMIKNEAEKLEAFYSNIATDEGINSYRIQVHSMKNSAALVGIVTLSGMAKVLEDAARNFDRDTIYAMTPVFLREWCGYREKLTVLFPKNVNVETYDKNVLTDLLEHMKQAADELDITEMDNLMEEMNGYGYDGILAEKMEQLAVLVGQFDTEQTMALVDEIKVLL
ncbi:MAG: response regulator, partial [Lachnospiraceae bacterium]|nr:response regulator [Lachnospiraceae bacterium]